MFLRPVLMAAASAILLAGPALAQDITVDDAYARASGPGAMSGAAFLTIRNAGASDDRLLGVASDVAAKVELHTHLTDDNGVMKMIHVEAGFPLPAGGAVEMERGGDHVMLMGLTRDLVQGEAFRLTLEFEQAGEMTVEVPVDNERMPGDGAHGGSD